MTYKKCTNNIPNVGAGEDEVTVATTNINNNDKEDDGERTRITFRSIVVDDVRSGWAPE